MTYEDIVKWFEGNPEAKPGDLIEDIGIFMRAAHSGQIATPADFLARFYILHLKKQGKKLPKGPADFDLKFVEKASDFFDLVAARCFFWGLKQSEMVTYENTDTPLLDSREEVDLKVEVTEKGREALESIQKQLSEAYKEAQGVQGAEGSSKEEQKPE